LTLASFLFTDEKTFTVAAPKNRQNDWQNAFAATKKKDVAIKRLHTGLTFNHWWHQSVSHKWLTVHQFNTVDHGVKINEAYYCNVMLLNSFCLLYVRSQASSSSFSRACSTPARAQPHSA